jgi:hypothetical protein
MADDIQDQHWFNERLEQWGMDRLLGEDNLPEFFQSMQRWHGSTLPGVLNYLQKSDVEELYHVYDNSDTTGFAEYRHKFDRQVQALSALQTAMGTGESSGTGMVAASNREGLKAASADVVNQVMSRQVIQGAFSDIRYEDESQSDGGGSRRFNEVPTYDELKKEIRYIVDYRGGEERVLGGQLPTGDLETTGLDVEPGGEADRYRKLRAEDIEASRNSPKTQYWNGELSHSIQYSAVQAQLGGLDFSGAQVEASSLYPASGNGKLKSGADRVSRVRNSKGQYVSNKIEFNLHHIGTAGQLIGRAVRAQILANYEKSSIREDTGTLRKAIEQAHVEDVVSDDGKSLSVTITLASLVRPARAGRDVHTTLKGADGENVHLDPEEVSTDFYAPLVFYGRRAMIAKNSPVIRFFAGGGESINSEYGGWHTTRNVRASQPHPEVFEMSKENMDAIFDGLEDTLKLAIAVQKSVNEGSSSWVSPGGK